MRSEQFTKGIKIYTVWEEAGLFRYVYRNDTLITRTEQQLDINYEFHFHTDTEGELFIYNKKNTSGMDENTKRLFHGYHFVLDKEKETITYQSSTTNTLGKIKYHWDGEQLILDGESVKKAS
ncbi:MAG: hypothetical protein AAF632_09835 [Bacteroidota bacterium]